MTPTSYTITMVSHQFSHLNFSPVPLTEILHSGKTSLTSICQGSAGRVGVDYQEWHEEIWGALRTDLYLNQECS